MYKSKEWGFIPYDVWANATPEKRKQWNCAYDLAFTRELSTPPAAPEVPEPLE